MRTVSSVVQEIMDTSPYLSEALYDGIANAAQIARRIRPQVETRLYEKVSDASICMALHRMRHDARPIFGTRFLKQIHDVTVRSNLIEYIFITSERTSHILQEASKLSSKKEDGFFNYSRGVRETLLIVNREFEKNIDKLVAKESNVNKVSSLSAITMQLPESSLSVPGVYYPILRSIALAGISLEEVVSVRNELTILFKDQDISRAFEVLKKIIG